MQLSVIICTHNPRKDYLQRVLAALEAQTLPWQEWELLLIDNASKDPLKAAWDLSWHPNARHILETELGLTPARLRGIKESTGKLLIFVDDDNILANDYLETALARLAEKPWVGAWSAGNIVPEYECQPAAWLDPFVPYLALNNKQRETWSNDCNSGLLPIGAGMILQRAVAKRYYENIQVSVVSRKLGRVGNSLLAAEDTEMGLCACELGLACGHCPALRVTHLIPRRRVKTSYLIHLARDVTRSHQILSMSRGLLVLSRQGVLKQFLIGLITSPWRFARRGPGPTLLEFVKRWADWLALGDHDRLGKLGAAHTLK
jgi:hypothetical protein